MEYVDLGSEEKAFAKGGNRLCFVDPRDPHRCIKVDRPDRSPAMRRKKNQFPKNVRPLSSFDENREEMRVIQDILRRCGNQANNFIPACYGFVETNFGKGLVLELLRDFDQRISVTLLQYVWENGLNNLLRAELEKFIQCWSDLGIPSRKLLLHNIVVQQSAQGIERIVVIDGLGWAMLIPLGNYSRAVAKYQARKKARQLFESIELLLEKQQSGNSYGIHGWLPEEKRNIINN